MAEVSAKTVNVPLSMLTYAEIFAASPGFGRFVVASNAKTESFCPAVFLRMSHPQQQPIEITHQPGGSDEPKRNIISDARAPVASGAINLRYYREPSQMPSATMKRVGCPRLVLKQDHLVPASINSSFRSKGVQASQFGCPHVTCIQRVQNPLRFPLPLTTAKTPLQWQHWCVSATTSSSIRM